MAKTRTPRKALPAGIGKVLKRLHYPLDLIQLCVRWYVAYSLSLRNLEEMMAERGIEVDRSSVHRWVIKLVPLFEKAFRRHKRAVGKSWRMDEISVRRSKTPCSTALCVPHRAFNIPLCACWSARRRPALSQSCRAVSSRCGRKAALAELMGTICAPTDIISRICDLQHL
jgi:hypothetical protein